ncbi:MAG: DUF2490 domain-containing protein [Owenweeksia sp.]|nr:DUF2490 domain-containing protein [Owenweeksia sp.]
MFRKYTPSQSASYEHRITQQFVHLVNAGPLRLSHRVRLEQRIFDIGFEGRLRYRFGGEMPLKG